MEAPPFSIAVSSSSSSSSQSVFRSLSSLSYTSSLICLRNNRYKGRHLKVKCSGKFAVRASFGGDSGTLSLSLSANEFFAHFKCSPS